MTYGWSTVRHAAHPPPLDYSQRIRYVLNSVEVCLPLIHPSVAFLDVSLTAFGIVFCVSVVNVGAGRLVGDGCLANVHRLHNWFALEYVEAFKELHIKISVSYQ